MRKRERKRKLLRAFCALAWSVSPLSRGSVQQGVIPRGSAGATEAGKQESLNRGKD